MDERYKQCVLSKPVLGGVARMIGWLPERLAVAGTVVDPRTAEASSQLPGWQVDMVTNVTEPVLDVQMLDRQCGGRFSARLL